MFLSTITRRESLVRICQVRACLTRRSAQFPQSLSAVLRSTPLSSFRFTLHSQNFSIAVTMCCKPRAAGLAWAASIKLSQLGANLEAHTMTWETRIALILCHRFGQDKETRHTSRRYLWRFSTSSSMLLWKMPEQPVRLAGKKTDVLRTGP